MNKFRFRGEDGSIILTVLVILVASALIVAMVGLTEKGLRQSRRAGDSSNALQVADAGISDAVTKAAAFEASLATPPSPYVVAGYSCAVNSGVTTCTSPTPVAVGSTAGTYLVEATRDPDPKQPVWHIVSTGTDTISGQKRRIRADAVSTIGPSLALFVSSNLKLKAGSEVDSYRNTLQTCTGNGYVGTNDAASFTLTSGTASNGNCQGTTWGHPYDGCVSYADSNPANFDESASGCPPPPASKKVTPSFVAETVYPPASPAAPTDQFGITGPGPCSATNRIAPGTYYWHDVKLYDGCGIGPVDDPNAGPVKIFTRGNVVLGPGGGGGLRINKPPVSCDTAGGDYRYCARWPSKFQIFVISSTPTTLIQIANNNTDFWGVITAPTAKLTTCSGCPQSEIWGALSLEEADAPTQLSLHYDESLGGDRFGRFERRNWVQEGV